MSNFSNLNSKFRSSSPLYASKLTSDSSYLFEKQKELIHQQVSQLPNSPRSKAKLEQTLEEILKSVHFFKKPDIIPYPSSQAERLSETDQNWEFKHKELSSLFIKERTLRKSLEAENQNLKQRLASIVDLEKDYEEYRLKALKFADLAMEVENLNTRIKILLDENDLLRKKIKIGERGYGSCVMSELEVQKEENSKLEKRILYMQEAYEELRQAYMQDVNSQKDRYDRLYREKVQMEVKMRENLTDAKQNKNSFEQTHEKIADKGLSIEPQAQSREKNKAIDDDLQEKIKNMKNEYLDKLRKLEERIETERFDHGPKRTLKDMEDKLGSFQERLAERAAKEKAFKGGETPKTEKLEKETSRRYLETSPRRTGHKELESDKLKHSTSGKISKKKLTSSRSRSSSHSPNPTTRFSRSPVVRNECQTCVYRHGHEWAKSSKNV